MSIRKQIPNFITLMNLLSGSLSLYFIMEGNLTLAAYMVFFAAGFDFLDGLAARVLKAYSPLGAQLDSLADLVSFGVAPAFIIQDLIKQSHGRISIMVGEIDLLPLIAFILPLFAALRLAKFNIDTRQSDSFLGLPTPAVGLLIASLPLIREQLYESQSLTYMVFTNTYLYLGTVILLSVLMVTELPLFALKFKSYSIRGNEIRYIFLTSSLILLVFFHFMAIPFIVLIYLFLSLIVYLSDLTN